MPSIGQLISAPGVPLPPAARASFPPLYAAAGHATIVGVTGAPGSGKSTLVGALAGELRARGKTVAIVAVDPSSSLSGGSILGDRIRMQQHTLDQGMFVRSMSTRGWLGGVSRATFDAVTVLDAAGWDYVIVETVGVGQADVEIVRLAHTTIVVSVPGMGDDIQAIKAGLLEVADLHVVNKADRPDSDKVVTELLSMLTLGDLPDETGWAIPVLATEALTSVGVPELADSLEQHAAWLRESGELERRERLAAAGRIRSIAKELVVAHTEDPSAREHFDELVTEVAARRSDPHSAAAQSDRGTDQPRPSPGEDVMTMSSTEATKLIEDAVREQVEQELRDWEGGELAEFLGRARPRASRRTSTSPARGCPSGASTRPPTWRTPPGRTSAFPAATRSPAAPIRPCTAAAPGRCARSPASAPRTRPTSASST